MQSKRKHTYTALVCLLLLSGVVLLINAMAQAPEKAQLVFFSDRDGNREIYVMDVDGKNQRRLTNHPESHMMPAWSPDGQKIAFASARDYADLGWEIYVMDADGKNPRNLANNPGRQEYSPEWSPDGQRIVFYSDRDGNYEIYAIDADGKNQHRIASNPATDEHPSWSPDGERIAFNSDRDGNEEIYVMDADGKNQRRLTDNPAADWSPSWSPDGQRIAFNRTDTPRGVWDAQSSEIYVMDADGKNQHRLTNNPSEDEVRAWSPDRQRIVFKSNRDGNYETYIMDADGKNQRNLTNNPANDWASDWFDPAFARIITPVSPASMLKGTWGEIRRGR